MGDELIAGEGAGLRRRRQGFPSRWAVVRCLLRAGLAASILVVLYAKLPVSGRPTGQAATVLVGGLIAFLAVIVWQVRAIATAEYPTLRTIESMATALPLFLLVFATAYVLLDAADADAFSEPLSKLDALYFTVTVFATVGFGDIAPRSAVTRAVTTAQMLADLLVLGLVLRLVLRATREGLERKAATFDPVGRS